jgi:hypothetical protein
MTLRIRMLITLSVTLTLSTGSGRAQMTTPPVTPQPKVIKKYPISAASGAGTSGHIVKWIDNTGSLGDSVISEQNGWIGINTELPTSGFHLYAGATGDAFAGMGPDTVNGPAMNFGYSGASLGRSSGFFNMRPDTSAVAPNPSLRFLTANLQRMIITNTGSVGIGLSSNNAIPVATLDVGGTAHFSGNVTIDGNIAAKYQQDVAEWVPATEAMAAGTVVVVSGTATNTVEPSQHAYDARVAGVVSAQPGLILGESSATKAKIATTGRVRVRIDARKHPVVRGDLLVTSDTPGSAMVSEPLDLRGVKIHRPGTLIGKALEPLAGGEGEILVLLSLQ